MLQQFRALPLGQKIYVLCLLLLALAFLPIYALVISRVGYDHQGTLFLPQSSQDSQVYSAKFLGEPSCFTVFPDKSVLFQHGQQTYGPYTARLDGSALPEQHPKSDQLTGIVLYQKDQEIFRGGVGMSPLEGCYLVGQDDDGSNTVTTYTIRGNTYDQNGQLIDPAEPSPRDIVNLMAGCGFTHRGSWKGWIWGLILCLINALSVLYAEDLFYIGVMFRVKNAESAEPTDWALTCRYISWGTLTAAAVLLLILGLR